MVVGTINGYPAVISTYPEDGVMDALLDAAIQARFSLDMDAASISSSTFYVARVKDNITVPCTPPEYTNAGRTASIVPVSLLEPSTQYAVTVVGLAVDAAGAVCDILGRPLQATYSWTFTTRAAHDAVAPDPVAPAEGSICTAPCRFAWSGAADIGDVQVSYDAGFTRIAAQFALTSGELATAELSPGTYWWRVRMIGGEAWSRDIRFSVVAIPEVIDDFEPRLLDALGVLGLPIDTDAIRVELPGRVDAQDIGEVSLLGRALYSGIESHEEVLIKAVETQVVQTPTVRTIVTIRF